MSNETRFYAKYKVLMLKGEKGDKGDDGVSPTLSETAIDNGYRVTITDAEGTSSFDLHNATSGDYSGLTNKPSINGALVSGNKTFQDFGIREYVTESRNISARNYETIDVPLSQFGITDYHNIIILSVEQRQMYNQTSADYVNSPRMITDIEDETDISPQYMLGNINGVQMLRFRVVNPSSTAVDISLRICYIKVQ